MPGHSLRIGTRLPNPGAVLKGCPRPKALRFDSPLGTPSAFGDGTYSGNIMQGGVALQPQDYLLDGVTPLLQCIVITGAATVAPDATSGAAVFMAHNLALVGATASLSASTNCKGLLGFVSGVAALRGGAHLHMDKLGKAGNFGNLTAYALAPTGIKRKLLAEKLGNYIVLGEGAAGASGAYDSVGHTTSGHVGASATAMQTGGGGSGPAYKGASGSGGNGGPCCGGAGSGAAVWSDSPTAGGYGGPGGNATEGSSYNNPTGGGAGDPVGLPGADGGASGEGAGGGLLGLFAARLDIVSGCIVSSDGAPGGTSNFGGGSAGGGCLLIVTKPGGYTNNGTVRAAGGVAQNDSGNGGPGSVNIFELAA